MHLLQSFGSVKRLCDDDGLMLLLQTHASATVAAAVAAIMCCKTAADGALALKRPSISDIHLLRLVLGAHV